MQPPRPTAYIDLLSANGALPRALVKSLESRGFSMRRFTHCAELADAVQFTPSAVLLVETDQLAPACKLLDAVAAQSPAAAGVALFSFAGAKRLTRFDALVQGAEDHAERLDEAGLDARILALLDEPGAPPMRVLLVDDDARSRAQFKQLLEHAGMQVEECADARDVPAHAAKAPPDLVLLDLHLHGTDGLSLARELRSQAATMLLPIVVVSGDDRRQTRFQVIQAGADDFLQKPVSPRALVIEVRSRIRRARRQSPLLAAPTGAAAPEPPVRGGLLRRGDFLAQLSAAQKSSRSEWQVLASVKIDQATELAKRLGQTGAYEVEQAVAQRLAALLHEDDAYTLWLEFGFGILLQRNSRDEVAGLAQSLCRHVAATPFTVRDETLALSISIGLALPPTGAAAGDPDRWFAAAYAGMSIAHRLGGNRYDGVLSLEHGDMPAERVLIIREFVKDAARGEHIVIEFQPMLPLRSEDGGQYALVTKLRDFRAPLAGIRRDEYLIAAREADAVGMIERMSVFSAFEAIQEDQLKKRNTRILVAMDLPSLDATQLGWLMAELRRRKDYADRLIIEFDANRLLNEPDLADGVYQLKECGVTVSVSEPSGSLARLEHLHHLPIDLLRLPHAAIDGVPQEALATLLAPWRAKGCGLIVDQVRNLDTVASLWELGIDYLQGDALAAAGPRLDYDFMQLNG
jgi:PleD family two-component response regulator/EAL domain-containing protein (putative c-di-GMP-specific phosphodiesterase class I)